MPNKLTDSEITIKALKETLELVLCEGDLQRASTISHTINLINRQKEENEKWQQVAFKHEETLQIIATEKQYYFDKLQSAKADIEKLKDKYSAIYQPIGNAIAEAKAEAYKEFAERLKKHSYFDHKDQRKVVAEVIIDHYLKKLVGEDNG